jgi:hypothetical protein
MTMRSMCLSMMFVGVILAPCAVPVAIGADPSSPADGPSMQEPGGGHDEPGAQEEGGRLAPNCRAEIKQLCQGIEPGSGRIRKCIKENEGKLSAPCRQQIEAHRERAKARMQELKAACEGDVKRFCPNVEPGGGRIAGCLKDHSKELSSGCAQAIESRRHRGDRSSSGAAPPQQ